MHLFEASLLRLEGDLRVLGRGEVEAEKCFVEALVVARRQGAQSFELRAATRLARLCRSREEGSEARQVLAPVYGWFTEGFDTLDLKEAKEFSTVFEKRIMARPRGLDDPDNVRVAAPRHFRCSRALEASTPDIVEACRWPGNGDALAGSDRADVPRKGFRLRPRLRRRHLLPYSVKT